MPTLTQTMWRRTLIQTSMYLADSMASNVKCSPFADHYGVATPAFRPHAAELAYYRGAYCGL